MLECTFVFKVIAKEKRIQSYDSSEQINLDETELGVSHVHHNETKTVLKTKYNYQADFNLDFDYGYENKTKGFIVFPSKILK